MRDLRAARHRHRRHHRLATQRLRFRERRCKIRDVQVDPLRSLEVARTPPNHRTPHLQRAPAPRRISSHGPRPHARTADVGDLCLGHETRDHTGLAPRRPQTSLDPHASCPAAHHAAGLTLIQSQLSAPAAQDLSQAPATLRFLRASAVKKKRAVTKRACPRHIISRAQEATCAPAARCNGAAACSGWAASPPPCGGSSATPPRSPSVKAPGTPHHPAP